MVERGMLGTTGMMPISPCIPFSTQKRTKSRSRMAPLRHTPARSPPTQPTSHRTGPAPRFNPVSPLTRRPPQPPTRHAHGGSAEDGAHPIIDLTTVPVQRSDGRQGQQRAVLHGVSGDEINAERAVRITAASSYLLPSMRKATEAYATHFALHAVAVITGAAKPEDFIEDFPPLPDPGVCQHDSSNSLQFDVDVEPAMISWRRCTSP